MVADSKRARDSRFVEILGHYNPRSTPAVFELDHERVAYWLKAGARPSDTVKALLARHPAPPKETQTEPQAEAAAVPAPQDSEAKGEVAPAAEGTAEGPAPAAPGEGEGQ